MYTFCQTAGYFKRSDCLFYSHLIPGRLAVRDKRKFFAPTRQRKVDYWSESKGALLWKHCVAKCIFIIGSFMHAFIQIINNVMFKSGTWEHAVTYLLQKKDLNKEL